MPDAFRNLRMAVVSVVNGDSGAGSLQTIMGRVPAGTLATALIVPWKLLKTDGPLPIIAYQILAFGQNGKDNDTRAGRIRFSIFAHGVGGLELCENIAARLDTLITHARLIAAVPALDCAPMNLERLYLNDAADEDAAAVNLAPSRELDRVDVEMDLELTQAA